MTNTKSNEALTSYEQRTGIPLLIVSVSYLCIVFVQVARTAGQAKRTLTRRSPRWLVPVGLLLVALAAVITWRYETAAPDASIQSWSDAACGRSSR